MQTSHAARRVEVATRRVRIGRVRANDSRGGCARYLRAQPENGRVYDREAISVTASFYADAAAVVMNGGTGVTPSGGSDGVRPFCAGAAPALESLRERKPSEDPSQALGSEIVDCRVAGSSKLL